MKKNYWVYAIKSEVEIVSVGITSNMYKTICRLRQNRESGKFKIIYTEKFDTFIDARFKAQIIRSRLSRHLRSALYPG